MNEVRVLGLIFVLFSVCCLFAHPADSITASYDLETKLLEIRILHDVPAEKTTKHYIEEIQIKVNDEVILEHAINQQESGSEQTALYKLTNINENDKIEIITKCNKFGKKSIEIIVNK